MKKSTLCMVVLASLALIAFGAKATITTIYCSQGNGSHSTTPPAAACPDCKTTIYVNPQGQLQSGVDTCSCTASDPYRPLYTDCLIREETLAEYSWSGQCIGGYCTDMVIGSSPFGYVESAECTDQPDANCDGTE